MSQILNEAIDYAWMNLDNISQIETGNPLARLTQEQRDNPHKHIIQIMRNPDYFYFTCKILFGIELLPFQCVILQELWNRPFPMLVASRGAGKSWILALYAVLRATLTPGAKVVIVGAAFRQSKVIFEYIDTLWKNSPVYRSFIGDATRGPRRDIDRCYMNIGNSFIIAIPLGDGQKIRGLRATHIISDEFASIPQEIFENVVAGFAVVSANPVEGVKRAARQRKMKELNIPYAYKEEKTGMIGNQSVISGTAYYEFNHMAEYWKRYCGIVKSNNNRDKLREIFAGEVPENFDSNNFCVMRFPITSLPEGFMDEQHVARSKATVHSGIFQMEFGAVFTTDSAGFFKRSLIESCVTNPEEPVQLPSGDVSFSAKLFGDRKKKYVYGVDPASEADNFSIVVLEIHPDHRRIVYCWTTTRTLHKRRVKEGYVDDSNFYGYCARKIRELMKVFPCERIVMDKQGGGVAVYECLHDPDKLQDKEQPIWEIEDPDDKKDTDGYAGDHILEFASFSDSKWMTDANHGLRKDFEDRICLFPYYDPLTVEFALHDDKDNKREFDTLEDCVWEIEELKDELATIVHSETTMGREKWDTPEVKLAGSKKGRLRKDRYSALLMANHCARTEMRAPEEIERQNVGGFINTINLLQKKEGAMYTGPQWFVQGMSENIGKGIRRR